MPILFVTKEQAIVLREMVKVWPSISQRLAAIIGGSDITANESPEAKSKKESARLVGPSWFKIKSSSSIGSNQWNYKGRVMKSGDSSAITGLVETSDTTQFDLRNAFEQLALGGITGISSLLAIANDSVVFARPEIRNGSRIYVFERVNDLVCNVSSAPSIITVDTELMAGETLALVDASGGPVTITLAPTSDTDVPGVTVTVKKIDSSANAVTIVPAGSETIDGAASKTLTVQYQYIAAVPDDTDYYVTSES